MSLSICSSLYPFLSLSLYLSLYISASLYLSLSLYLSVYLSASLYLSLFLYLFLSISLSISLRKNWVILYYRQWFNGFLKLPSLFYTLVMPEFAPFYSVLFFYPLCLSRTVYICLYGLTVSPALLYSSAILTIFYKTKNLTLVLNAPLFKHPFINSVACALSRNMFTSQTTNHEIISHKTFTCWHFNKFVQQSMEKRTKHVHTRT